MIILGLATVLATQQYDSGFLSDQFRQSGQVSDSNNNNNNNDNIISIEQILEAEKRLIDSDSKNYDLTIEHNAEIHELFKREHHDGAAVVGSHSELGRLHVGLGSKKENDLNSTTYEYSRKETAHDQNNSVVGGDLTHNSSETTTLGRTKRGVQDPNTKNSRHKFEQSMYFLTKLFNEQQRMARLLADLEERISELESKVEKHNKVITELEDLHDGIDDINDNSIAGTKQRTKLNAWAKDNGVNLEKFKRADGSFDEEEIKRAINEHKEEVTILRDKAQIELEQAKQDYMQAKKYSEDLADEKSDELKIAKISGSEDQVLEAENNLVASGNRGRSDFLRGLSDDEKIKILIPEAASNNDSIKLKDLVSCQDDDPLNGELAFSSINDGFTFGSNFTRSNTAILVEANSSELNSIYSNKDKAQTLNTSNSAVYGSFANEKFASNDDDFSNITNISSNFNNVSDANADAPQPLETRKDIYTSKYQYANSTGYTI